MKYQIVSTGSKGNAVILNDKILIDCGVSFKSLSPYIKPLVLVLLTHSHGDHFNPSTVRRLAEERPTLRFGTPPWLVDGLVSCAARKSFIDVYEMHTVFDYAVFKIEPFPLIHNVPNCGYKIHINGKNAIYATDTNSLNNVEAKGFDLYMIESNYSEPEIAERIRLKQESGKHIYEYDVLNNHLSREKADDWLYRNMSSKSTYVYLHGHEESK